MNFPKIELEDVADIMCLSVEELDKVPYEEKFWLCGVEDCTHWTKIRDYGLHPVYYWKSHRCWVNVSNEFMFCGACNKRYKLKFRFKYNLSIAVKTFCIMPVKKEELHHMMHEKQINT